MEKRNLEFTELTEEEYKKFIKNRDDLSFLQTPEIAHLRKSYGSEIKYLGVKENNEIVCASMFSITITFRGKKTFYAPRGFLIDYEDLELLSFYTRELKKYSQKRNGLMIKIDPNVNYQIRDINGNPYPDTIPNDKVINNLKKIGFIHYGFNLDFEYTQSRWNFLVKLDVPYEELVNRFSKSTRKNIEATYERGIDVRKATIEDLESMEEILIKTAERKHFKSRDLEYYKRMYKYLKDDVQIYIAYIDKNKYVKCSKKRLEESKEKLKLVEDKMKKDMVGAKLKKQLEIATNGVEKCKNELKEAEEFAQKIKDKKDIGVLISVKSGKEYITLYSGYLTEYSIFTPKYAMYNEHIKDAYKYGIPYCNFYGISGNFNKNDKNYGMYEFKRGFGGEVQELIGEFTYPVSKLYYVYMTLRKIKQKINKIRK